MYPAGRYAYSYYPFGSPMPGRSWSGSYSRFGFNGKEKENEITVDGGDYDFGERIYDARLGKFFSLDIKTRDFAYWSPYLFAAVSFPES